MARAKGEGSVYYAERERRWVAQVEDGFTPTGRRRYRRRYRKTRKAAVDVLGQLQREVARNLEPGTARQTVSQYLDVWLDSLEGNRAPKTIAAYRADIAHVTALIGKVRLDKLTPHQVRQMMAALPKRGLAPKSALNVRTTLHTALEQAHKDRIIDFNPVSTVDRPQVPRYNADALTVAQARDVLEALAAHRLYALYAVAVAVGLRLSEARGLTWPRIDLDTGMIQVRHQVQRVGPAGDRHYVLRDLKNRRVRDVPLPTFAVKALRDHRLHQKKEQLEATVPWTDGCCDGCDGTGWGLVFTTLSDRSAGRPLHETQARKEFQDICETTIGIRPRFHDLRHTAATLLLAQRVPLAEVQQILGHSSIQVTRDVYAHLEAEHLRAAADSMDELLG